MTNPELLGPTSHCLALSLSSTPQMSETTEKPHKVVWVVLVNLCAVVYCCGFGAVHCASSHSPSVTRDIIN